MSARARTILIGVAVALVIVLAWYFLLWSPAGEDLTTAKQERAAAELRRNELQTRLARLQKLEANQDQILADQAKLAAAIPESDQLDTFIIDVNQRAFRAGVNFVSISPQQPGAAAAAPVGAAGGGPAVIGLQIQATGTYLSILNFMEALRDGTRLVTVENLTLSPGGPGGEVSAAITGRMFVSTQQSANLPPALPAS